MRDAGVDVAGIQDSDLATGAVAWCRSMAKTDPAVPEANHDIDMKAAAGTLDAASENDWALR